MLANHCIAGTVRLDVDQCLASFVCTKLELSLAAILSFALELHMAAEGFVLREKKLSFPAILLLVPAAPCMFAVKKSPTQSQHVPGSFLVIFTKQKLELL